MLHGEFESMRMINSLVPNNCPKPLSWGQCANPSLHYLLFSFHELKKGPPDVDRMSQLVANFHTESVKENPTGKWGFHMTTYNGPLAQDNSWTDTWEESWIRGMKRLFEYEKAARGPSEELEQLIEPYFEKVCPRLLRPLETNGRHITPVLIHGDLWLGNMAVEAETGDPFIFDAASLWGHNECESQPRFSTESCVFTRSFRVAFPFCKLALLMFEPEDTDRETDELSYMRPIASDWGTNYVDAYHKLIPKAEPQKDWDARNALYATYVSMVLPNVAMLIHISSRVVVVDSAIYPEHEHFRTMYVPELFKFASSYMANQYEQTDRRDTQIGGAISGRLCRGGACVRHDRFYWTLVACGWMSVSARLNAVSPKSSYLGSSTSFPAISHSVGRLAILQDFTEEYLSQRSTKGPKKTQALLP